MNPTIKRFVEKVTGNLWGNKNEFDGKKFDHLTDVQKSRLGEFVREISLLTKEENAAIEHRIPMTQELFEQCVRHCIQIDAMFRMTCLLNEYPQFTDEYSRKIEAETSKFKLLEETPQKIEERVQKLYEKIIAKYGKEKGEFYL